MTIDFYCSMHSPFCRTVLLVAKAVGVELNPLLIFEKNNEHKEAFIKVSASQH
jgi:hypothetical protein